MIPGRRISPSARMLVLPIVLYQRIPRAGAGRCRFYPTCSQYAVDALRLHGAVRGLALAARRLLRCHPFHPGGIDPVPGTASATRQGD